MSKIQRLFYGGKSSWYFMILIWPSAEPLAIVFSLVTSTDITGCLWSTFEVASFLLEVSYKVTEPHSEPIITYLLESFDSFTEPWY